MVEQQNESSSMTSKERLKKYVKYAFYDYAEIVTRKTLSNNQIMNLIAGLKDKGVDCIIKLELKKVSVLDIYEYVKEQVPTERERQIIINHLPRSIEAMYLHKYIILLDELNKNQMEDYLNTNGLYPSFIAETFKWSL